MNQRSLRSLLCLLFVPWLAQADGTPKRPLNLLFIITDQLRWDALGCAGNTVIRTPNLDRLAREGAWFAKAYSSCPVCVPARTTILTGHSSAGSGVITNEDVNRTDLPELVTFDQLLLRDGYHGEYFGKWHTPYKYALEYTNGVRWVNGPRPPGSRADMNESQALQAYMDANVPLRPLQPGEHLANLYGRPYRPDPLDGASRLTPEQVAKLGRDKAALAAAEVGQGTTYGCLDVPPEHTMTAWTANEGLAALDRLKDGPFTLTVSINAPHPPMVLPKPYYGMYPADQMKVPASIDDARDNSPYPEFPRRLNSYRDKANVRQMISDYYGLVTEADEWIGRILKRLDQLGLTDNTLVVFTADHGEMLGDHGMNSKFVFYEGSAHIPLIMRLPKVIPSGTVVNAPVAQIDLFATILDYVGFKGHASEGHDLRPLIDGKDDGSCRIVVSEWNGTRVPGFMVYDGRWKLLFGASPEARSLDALYDLLSDPQELINLIGHNPDRERHRAEAERMKALLVGWLERVKSKKLDGVIARPVIAN